MFHRVIGTCEVMSQFHRIEESETHQSLKYLLSNPEGLEGNVRRTASAIILQISHGYDVKDENDPFVSIADQAFEQFSLFTSPGVFLVNSVPALRFLPEWFPGAGFKKTAKAWRKILHDMAEGPNQFAKQQIELGVAKPSMLSNLLQDESKLSDEEIHDIKWASTSLYAGGADIVVAAIHAFFKAMVLHPDVQAQAQAEIDAVIGNERLLNIEDRRRLLYISALAMEVLRCHVVTPNGGPHRVTEDDIHDGYLIPKGALILPNVWKMTRDASVYKFPSSFNLARYIKTEDHEPEFDPRYMVWKKNMSRPYPLSIFISCAMTLAVFDTTPYMEDGKPIMPDVKQSTGIISHPSKFKCNTVPRSQRALDLINAAAE